MQPYNITLPEKKLGYVINKRSGIRRPTRFLFFKYRNSERIIAYTVIVESGDAKNQFVVFKKQKDGRWLKGARKNGVSITQENERKVALALKSAIDEFEHKKGQMAFQELF